MSKVRVNQKSLDFIKTGFKSKEDMSSIMKEYLNMRNLVKYEGDQEVMGVMFPLFTDKKSGSTFMIQKGNTLYDTWKSVK